MKKVLALVLAVIMVCTMAFAVTVDTTTTAPADDSKVNTNYRPITPGKSIIFSLDDLGLATGYAANKDGTFAPEKNKVEVTFAKGADLVASQGWVKTIEGDYKYIITTKTNETVALDDTADLIISKVAVTKYGIAGTTTYWLIDEDADGNTIYAYTLPDCQNDPLSTVAQFKDPSKYDLALINKNLDGSCIFYMAFDYGRLVDKTTIVAGATTPAAIAADILYTVKEGATVADKAYTWEETQGNCTLTRDLKVGETLYFNTIGAYEPTTAIQKDIWAKEASITKMIESTIVPNAVVDVVVNNAKEGSKLYMVTSAGLVDLGAKFDDNGVLKATVKVTGPIIMSDKALTAATPTTPGTTTNPGTGANDVVGVAAALAVVALVSGAAISLKK